DLVHQMPVDVDQAGAVRLLVHQMVVPDLVVEGARFGHCRSCRCAVLCLITRRAEKKCRPRLDCRGRVPKPANSVLRGRAIRDGGWPYSAALSAASAPSAPR